MPGKLCFGSEYANAGAARLRDSKAFCEGITHRATGTELGHPYTDNPHVDGSDAYDAWDLGWIIADAATGGAIPHDNAPCCAVGPAGVAA